MTEQRTLKPAERMRAVNEAMIQHGPQAFEPLSTVQAEKDLSRSSFWPLARYIAGAAMRRLLARDAQPPKMDCAALFVALTTNQQRALYRAPDFLKSAPSVFVCGKRMIPGLSNTKSPIVSWWSVHSRARIDNVRYISFRKFDISREHLRITLALFAALRLIETFNPRVVVIANDHSLHFRAIIWASHLLGAPTVYAQHASVSGNFPELATTWAALDGWKAARTYAACRGQHALTGPGDQTRIALTGMRNVPAARGDGVVFATNLIDQREVWDAAIACAVRNEKAITIRWHPREGNAASHWAHEWAARSSFVSVSDPTQEAAEDALERASVVVAGDSSILGEAALAGCRAIRLETRSGLSDYYGFVSLGIASAVDDPTDIARAIETAPAPSRAGLQELSATAGATQPDLEWKLLAATIEAAINGIEQPEGLSRVPWSGRAVLLPKS